MREFFSEHPQLTFATIYMVIGVAAALWTIQLLHPESARSRASRIPFKERAGVLTAFLVVISFVVIGFAQMAAFVVLGVEVKVPGDWSAAMLSLSSAALGFLIGQKIPSDVQSVTTTTVPGTTNGAGTGVTCYDSQGNIIDPCVACGQSGGVTTTSTMIGTPAAVAAAAEPPGATRPFTPPGEPLP